MSARAPKVSVITCVHNGERFLPAAIESILGQEFGDFEYWLVNDASTDRSREIIASYLHDPRVRVLDTEQNVGAYAAANLALAQARGEYVARMDADDLSLPHRLALQVEFLDQHPEVSLLGSAFEFIGEEDRPVDRYESVLARSEEIRWTLIFRNCIAHSTVMYRRELVGKLGGYRSGRYGCDYDLWLRMAFAAEVAQLPQICVRYRVTRGGITANHPAERRAVWTELRQRVAAELLGRFADDPLVLEFARRCECEGRAPWQLDFSWFDWNRRFALSLVEPFCARFGYGGEARQRVTALARNEAFWLVRWNEGDAPAWAFAMHLRLLLRHGQFRSLARLVPALAKFALGRRGLRLAKGVRARLSGATSASDVAEAKGAGC